MNKNERSEGEFHVLQNVLLPVDKTAADLYVRFITGYVECAEEFIAMDKGAKLSFDSWLNSFYETHWVEHAQIADAFLELEFEGSILVEVFRDSSSLGRRILNWKKSTSEMGGETLLVPIPLHRKGDLGVRGRIFFELTATKKTQIRSISFKTSTAPFVAPALMVGVGARGNYELLSRNLAVIQDALPQARIAVVHHTSSREGESRIDRPPVGQAAFMSIEGDATRGGLSDTVKQCLQHGDAATTHLIAIDDDVVVNGGVLRNLARMLAFVDTRTVLSGHEFDADRPWMLADREAASESQSPDAGFIDVSTVHALSAFNSCGSSVAGTGAGIVAGAFAQMSLSFGAANDHALAGGQESEGAIAAMPGIAVWRGQRSVDVSDYHDVQQMLLPLDRNVSDLYLRTLAGHVTVDESRIALAHGAKVSFNTYFNSFYESYWKACSDLEQLSLHVTFSGSIVVEVFRDTKGHGCSLIASRRMSSSSISDELFNVPLFKDGEIGEAGRLFVDISAESNAVVKTARFVSRQAPSSEPSITLGICTFNREAFVYRNLKGIASDPKVLRSIAQVIVVNQGNEFSNPELLELLGESEVIKVVEQRNLGGCGGFTRTMHESLRIEGVTHHVLMDDDAIIDPRCLHRLANFLGYAAKNIVVGGHMLDLLRPTVLYEAGAMVKPNSRIKPLHHNIDLRELHSLGNFNRGSFSDYNAWWFCAVPTRYIRSAKFPAPIFIRGDDMEYGVRLQEQGAKTVAMPGIAVWHEPFYVKVGGWQAYYDLRNRLIMASVYSHRIALETPKNIIWLILQALVLHDYMTTRLLCKAVQDFLKGPSLFDKDAEQIHKEVAQVSKTLGPQAMPEGEGLRPKKIGVMPKSDLAHAFLLVRRIAAVLVRINPGKRKANVLMDHEASVANVHARPYIKTNGIGSYRLLYRPDRLKMSRMLGMSLATVVSYVRKRKQAAVQWNGEIERLRSPEAWGVIFGEQQTPSLPQN